MSVTPPKNSPIRSCAQSPRLRSPKGFHHKNPGAFVLGLLRRTRFLLVVCAILAAFSLIRPNTDSGITLMDFSSVSQVASLISDLEDSDSPVWINPVVTVKVEDPPEYLRRKDRDVVLQSNDDVDVPLDLSTQNSDSEDSDSPPWINPVISVKVEDPPDHLRRKELTVAARSSNTDAIINSSTWIYDSKRQPLIYLPENRSMTVAADVHFVVDSSNGGIGTAAKFLLDGLDRSPMTNIIGVTFLTPDMHRVSTGSRTMNPMVWMVDWGSMLRDCHRLKRVLDKLQRKPEELVLLVDYSASTRQSRCEHVFPEDPNMRLAKRSIVVGRYFDRTLKTVHPGQIAPNSGEGSVSGPVIHTPLVVRERFVAAIFNTTKQRSPLTHTRDIDVCFFWKPGDYGHYGFWRREVANYVQRLGKAFKYATRVDLATNNLDGFDAGNVQLKYVHTLLHCKIVVIAQRDEWADHYRLYESLASGTLVLTDPMLTPPEGLKNNTNIQIYDSLEDLGNLIHLFLKHRDRRRSISKQGMELALGRYRSWHRVEELLFGSPIYRIDEPYSQAPGKAARPQMSLVDGDIIVPT
jgi:Glycosyl transferases group 1